MVWKKKYKQRSKGVEDMARMMTVSEQHPSNPRSFIRGGDASVSSQEVSRDGSVSNRSVTSKQSQGSTGETHSRVSAVSSVASRRSDKSAGQPSVHSQPPSVVSSSHSSVQSAPAASRTATSKKTVKFQTVQIREYERVVGDNPSCTIGPPIGIGWKYARTHVEDLNSYETARLGKRKRSIRLILSREEREALLLNWGASFHDIIEAVRANMKVKNQRRQTVVNIGKVERIEEAFESATRKLKRALLMRRSTGNKVKRLQEQADLAQSALRSLKIAEDRALSEIRDNRIPARQEHEKDNLADYNLDVAVSTFAQTSPVDAKVRSSHFLGDKQHSGFSSSFDTLDHSTTPSQKELERFYRELELEMFGDEDRPMPDFVGQTLEIKVPRGGASCCTESRSSIGTLNLDDYSTMSGIQTARAHEVDEILDRESEKALSMVDAKGNDDEQDEIDAALERERDRSMISRSLLDDTESEVGDEEKKDALHHHLPLQRLYPVHGDYVSSRYHSATRRLSSSLDSADPERGRLTESVVAVEYDFEDRIRRQHDLQPPPTVPPPLHAGMSMFEDCALLGGPDGLSSPPGSSSSSRHSGRKRSSSRRDANAGPKIRHVPLSRHISPSRWMEEDTEGSPLGWGGYYETITINEDGLERRNYYHQHNYNQMHYRRHQSAQSFPSSFF